MTALYPYQADGVGFLAGASRALLADEPGLGKTIQAIRAADATDARNVLVICPASVRENWRREILRFSERKWDFHVVSYDQATRGQVAMTPDTVILDEAHYLKNRKAKRTQAVYGKKCDGQSGIIAGAERVWALTGTPSPNDPSELWPLCNALFPDVVNGTQGWWGFVRRYCKTIDTPFGMKIVGGKNLEKLRAAMAPHMLRRKKADVLTDLPPIRFDTLPLSPAGGLKDLRQLESDDETRTVVTKVLKAIESGEEPPVAEVSRLRRLIGLAKVKPVADFIADELDGGTGKVVVFAHHKDVMEGLAAALERFGVTGISGKTASLDRQKAVDRFQTDDGCRVFVGQINAAGTGITLTAASDVVFAESSWVPADNSQAAMRCHRIGQSESVLVRFAMLQGSLDEAIQQAVERKTAMLAELFD